MAPAWRRKDTKPSCRACRGTGLRWGWWTLLITLPSQIVADIAIALLPWVVVVVLVLIGVALFSTSFWLLYAIACAVAGVLLVHYLVKLIAPTCGACGGRGVARAA